MSALEFEALAPPGIGRTVLGNVKAVGMLANMIEGQAWPASWRCACLQKKEHQPNG